MAAITPLPKDTQGGGRAFKTARLYSRSGGAMLPRERLLPRTQAMTLGGSVSRVADSSPPAPCHVSRLAARRA